MKEMKKEIEKLKVGEYYIYTDTRRKFYQDIRVYKTEWGYILTLEGVIHSLASYKKRCCHSVQEVVKKIEKMII